MSTESYTTDNDVPTPEETVAEYGDVIRELAREDTNVGVLARAVLAAADEEVPDVE
jgi:hypothetical protein